VGFVRIELSPAREHHYGGWGGQDFHDFLFFYVLFPGMCSETSFLRFFVHFGLHFGSPLAPLGMLLGSNLEEIKFVFGRATVASYLVAVASYLVVF
jgi:hypothetical protein